ncbi:MAG: hypothetical protein ABW133_08500 [Polyangiaceae bacterium]
MNQRLLRYLLSIGLPLLGLTHVERAEAQTTCGASAIPCTKRAYRGIRIDDFARDVANAISLVDPTPNPDYIPPKAFSVTVHGDDGESTPVLTLNSGQAQSNDGGGPFNFTDGVASAIGSVSKLLTEAAVRRMIEVNAEGSAYAACRVTLATPFIDVLPAAFKRRAQANSSTWYNGVSVEQVLQHRAGVPAQNPISWATVMNPVHPYLGCSQSPVKIPPTEPVPGCYSNTNYLIASTMLPLIRDCALRAQVDASAAAHCTAETAGLNRDTCEMNWAFNFLSGMANSIVKEMVLDQTNARASCDYPFVQIQSRIEVARGYGDRFAVSNGQYFRPTPSWCGAWGWQIPSSDLASVLRHIWDGAYFISENSMGSRMTPLHNGSVDNYRALTIHLVPGTPPPGAPRSPAELTFAVVANSPMDTIHVLEKVKAAFNAALDPTAGPTPPAPVPLLTGARGAWRCTGLGRHIRLRIANTRDIAAFEAVGFAGLGAEELWTASGGTVMSPTAPTGTYVRFPAGMGPKSGSNQTGTWSITRTGSNITIMTAATGGSSFSYGCLPDTL